MPTIVPNLWFDDQAEEAARFYTSVIKNSKILGSTRYPDAGQEVHGRPAGSVMTVEIDLDGNRYTAMNGGPEFKFNEAISIAIECKSQEEIDFYWDKLIEGGGSHGPCGWLKDRFGLSWQIVPQELHELQADPVKAKRLMNAFLKMKKLDIAALKRAAEGGS